MRTDSPRLRLFSLIVTLAFFTGGLAGCAKKEAPDFNRALPPGDWALRLLDEADWPDLQAAHQKADRTLTEALDRSIGWYATPSAKQFFPMHEISHERAELSAFAFKALLAEAVSPSDFELAVRREFDCYTSIGYDDAGTVLFTGYFTPIFKGSKVRTAEYRFPLYSKPDDLEIEPITGRVLGRRQGGALTPYPARREIEDADMLRGREIIYVRTRLDQYIIQVNGSARIELPDNSVMYVGYAGNNGHEYTGLGSILLREGVMTPEQLSLAAIRKHFADKPEELERYIAMNDRYVFFTEYDGSKWPAGSLGVKVTAKRTLATDKSVFPRGSVVLVQAETAVLGGGVERFEQFMLDQDTGGAIRAAGRGDIYHGIGATAELTAGRQFSEGRLYYFFLKPERLDAWSAQKAGGAAPGVAVR